MPERLRVHDARGRAPPDDLLEAVRRGVVVPGRSVIIFLDNNNNNNNNNDPDNISG